MENNKVIIKGTIEKSAVFSHEVYGECFFEMEIAVARKSGYVDKVPILISDRVCEVGELRKGVKVSLVGQFRSFNKTIDGKSKLLLYVFVEKVLDENFVYDFNKVEIVGYICKEPTYRETPLGREICDVLIAVNRSYNKSDYIPCILWGRNARFVRNLPIGEKLAISGRVQSREYEKRIAENEFKTMTAYELSGSKVVLGE